MEQEGRVTSETLQNDVRSASRVPILIASSARHPPETATRRLWESVGISGEIPLVES